eukprot:g20927.t1
MQCNAVPWPVRFWLDSTAFLQIFQVDGLRGQPRPSEGEPEESDTTTLGPAGSWAKTLASALPFFVAAGAGTTAFAFYDGLWVPLLRDGERASEVKRLDGFLPENKITWAAERLLAGQVVVLDGVVSRADLPKLHEELSSLASRPGALQANPKVKAGNVEIRCWDRNSRLRVTAAQLERGFAEVGAAKSFLLTDWTQLAHYTEGSGFYKWHRDGLESDWSGLLGWYYWLQRGAVRRRSVTGILYLNEEDGER